ncbi:GntR family transcriptional regulator [Shimia sp.]|uniref:GntR family transcriptional regulator n=1 Tax=Shimia sp. TaxID=1954381 RepID=UPI003BA8934B
MTEMVLDQVYIPETLEELPKHWNAGFEKFIQAVGTGQLPPGTTLTQAQLCDLLDLSLTPLRETLVLLEEYGLIEVKQRAGVTILNPELSFVRENYQFRILIEEEALRSFAASVNDDWLKAVRDRHLMLIDRLEQEPDNMTNVAAFVALDQFVHSSFVEALNNKSMLATHNRLQQNIRMVRSMQKNAAYLRNLLSAANEHLAIFEQIEKKDHEGAALSLRRHFEASIYRAVVSY